MRCINQLESLRKEEFMLRIAVGIFFILSTSIYSKGLTNTYCWGKGISGQIGNKNKISAKIPNKVKTNEDS